MTDEQLPDHVRANREAWDRYAEEYVEPGRRNWSTDAISWGIWEIPESAQDNPQRIACWADLGGTRQAPFVVLEQTVVLRTWGREGGGGSSISLDLVKPGGRK